MTKILVTGAGGQLGKSIYEIRNEYPEISMEFKTANELDITDIKALNSAFKNNEFEYCINCAAYTDVEQAEKSSEPAYAVNAEGVKNLAFYCAQHNCVLIHISTDYVFDGESEIGYWPTDKPNPINEYGKSKLLGEQHIQNLLDQYFIIRTSWLYSQFGQNFYTKIVEKAKSEDIIYVTDSQRGCPTKAAHLAQYILEIITDKKKNFGIHHFTDGEAMTWYDFAKRIVSELKLETKVVVDKTKNYPSYAARPRNSVLQGAFD